MKQANELETYITEINKYPLLSTEETNKLARSARKGNRRARNKLIKSNLRLVVRIAKQYLNKGLSFLDLIEEGNIGLMKAMGRFDPAKGKFSTYAGWWIKQTITRALITSAKTIRIPCHVVETIAKWKSASSELSQKLGRFPQPAEVCELMNLSPESLRLFKKTLQSGLSVSKSTSLDILTDPNIPPPHDSTKISLPHLFDEEESEWLEKLLKNITPKEALVLKMHYGLDEKQIPMTLREIGKAMGYSWERIRQIEKKALQKLKYAIIRRRE